MAGHNTGVRFPGHEEIRRYFSHVDATVGLRVYTIFDARVDNVKYDASSARWNFHTERGLLISSTFAIFACGSFSKPHSPALPNLETFRGDIIHPSAWPERLQLKGLPVDCLRTEPLTQGSMRQRSLPYRESKELKNYYDGMFHKAKLGSSSAIAYNQNTDYFHSASDKYRVALFERLWNRGDIGLTLSNYRDVMFNKAAHSSVYDFWAQKTRARMTDPEKRDIVAPLEQFQWFGAKRVNLEMDYYDMLDRSNVKIIELKKTLIASCYDQGFVTEGRKRRQRIPSTNAPSFIELQVDWIASLLGKLRKDDVCPVEPAEKSCRSWEEKVANAFKAGLFRESTARWTGANIAGKRVEPHVLFGGVQVWRQECQRALDDWSSFRVSKA
ncbi:cyclopentanone 1,2-monooxygenase [Colletotrichum fioriniae PJ7]|uniref:Cyclopentanone 1,2-monooxygenase n=1 Tax=Colletotrichum fioriniae PJ7 TaxID=1445577 RepID=A0A010QDK7_9PEZI|nr:cyclopentanone 1,2-monooxygenase [Colletotrichum fioriniae PJ7]